MPTRRTARSFRPSLDGLESRLVLSTLTVAPSAAISARADLNSQVVSFARAHLHQKVGGGECAHLINEALRAAGADFMGQDPHHNGDYVWGSPVTTITHGHDSSPSMACRPGDILQFQNVRLSSGWSATHHTAIVAAVDSHGRPTQVFQQNVALNGGSYDRTDRLDRVSINANTVLSGTIHVYRPVRRTDAPGSLQISVVNDTTQTQAVTVSFAGRPAGQLSLGPSNTAASYMTFVFSGSGSGSWSIGINGKTVTLGNARGYEVYTSGGQTSIRAI